MKRTHVYSLKQLKLFTKIEHDFPSWTDEIAKPHPDMNIKVAPFAVTE